MKATSLDRKIAKFGHSDRLYFHRYRLNNAEYHGCTNAVSSTALKDLYQNRNPRLCYEKYIARSLPFQQSEAMLIGAATHKIILELRSFKKEFAVWDGGRKYGKAYNEFKNDNADKSVISLDQYDHIRRMRDAVMRCPEANKLLSGGEAEQSVFWRDEETSLLCRARADYVKKVNGSKLLIDVKTCASAEPEAFTRELIRMAYPIQEAMYREGFQADAFAFIAIEKGDFNTVQVYDLDDLFDECGHLLYRQQLEKWAQYRDQDNWPTYREPVSTLECPEWFAAKTIGA